MLSRLTSTPPQMIIEADGKEDLVKKIFWKGVLEYRKRKMHVDDQKEAFVDSFITSGMGVYKVGRTVQSQKGIKQVKGEDGKIIADQEVEAITENKSFVENIDPRKFWLSPETKYTSPVLGVECPYCIEEMIKTPEYIETTYGVTVSEEEKELIAADDGEGGNVGKSSIPGEKTDDLKKVRLYAYYGVWKIKGKTITNAEVLFTSKKILKQRELPYKWGEKKPYIVSLNFVKFFKPVARGSLDALLDLDQEFNENMNKRRTYVRRMVNPKWAKLKGTKVDEDALLDPDVGVVVDESQPNAVRSLTPQPLGQELFTPTTAIEQLFYLM